MVAVDNHTEPIIIAYYVFPKNIFYKLKNLFLILIMLMSNQQAIRIIEIK